MRRMLCSLAALVLLAGMVAIWAYGDFLTTDPPVVAATAEVRDGDTMVADGRTIRLHGIDAPEYGQICRDAAGRGWPCGKAARAQLATYVFGGTLSCTSVARDRYDREVDRCSTATVPDLSAAMVLAGYAISPNDRGEAPYADEQAEAEASRRGIWVGRFDTPAAWRDSHPRNPSR
jgi:endonuclease YncB( thermonuclease family)